MPTKRELIDVRQAQVSLLSFRVLAPSGLAETFIYFIYSLMFSLRLKVDYISGQACHFGWQADSA